MSLVTKLTNLSDDDKNKICEELKINLKDKYMKGNSRYIYPYDLDKNDIIKIPFSFAINELKMKRRKRDDFSKMLVEFNGVLREEQENVKKEAIKYINKNSSVILSMYCGFGKTITSINISCSIKLRTLIIVNKIVLMNQWEDSIKTFCPNATVQKITTKSKKIDCDFCIINAINAEKFNMDFFNNIGLVIVDEAHLIMAERVSKSLNMLSPRYLIGLTATPYRPDGLDDLLKFYFGENKVNRELFRKHIVYKVETGFKPTIELNYNGQVNWNIALDSQSKDKKRNNLILEIITKYKDRNFLVLVKRVEQGYFIENSLKELGEDVTSLLGKNQDYSSSSRVLIGTCSKVGTGFDHPKLNTLLLAADVEEYFIQYLGRCMRVKHDTPFVFDLVDDHSLMKKHYNTRKNTYIKHGGIIKIYN